MRMMGKASSITNKELVLILTALMVFVAPAEAQVLPPAPQTSAAQDGTDGPGFIRVPSSTKGGTGGYIDVAGYKSCRYVTTSVGGDGAKNGEVIPVGSLATWRGYLAATIPGETQTVCCRPASPTDSFCSGGTVLSVSNVAGPDQGGYGKTGAAGTATAQCQDAAGYYEEPHTYSCQVSGSGVAADGVWQLTADQGDVCTSSPTTTYGACSTAGVGGWGYELATVKDCFGNVISSSYSGPSCYTAPPCTPTFACQGSAYVETCGGSSQTIGSCTLKATYGTRSCSPNYNDQYPDGTGCWVSYNQCSNDASSQWGCTSGDCSGSCVSDAPSGCYDTILSGPGCGQTSSGKTCPVISQSCSGSYWAPP